MTLEHHGQPVYIPTEEEKAKAIAEIQAGWTEEERIKKLGTNISTCVEVQTVPAKLLLGPGNVEKGTI